MKSTTSLKSEDQDKITPEQILMVETYKAQIKALEERLKNSEVEFQAFENIKARNEFLEQELVLLKEVTVDKDTGNDGHDDVSQLKKKLKESEIAQNSLQTKLEKNSSTITELENQIQQEEESLVKVEALENALLQFSSHIEQIELQNQQLYRDLVVMQQISEARGEKIESLTTQLQNQSKIVDIDTVTFEHKLNYLRTKLHSVKLSVPHQIPGKLSSQSLRSTTHSEDLETDKENILEGSVVDMKYPQKRGLNLNVVKSMRD